MRGRIREEMRLLKAIELVGGVGIDIIFGILPGVLLIKYGRGTKRAFGCFIVACFTVVLFFELGQEFGFLAISPHSEYWNAGAPHP